VKCAGDCGRSGQHKEPEFEQGRERFEAGSKAGAAILTDDHTEVDHGHVGARCPPRNWRRPPLAFDTATDEGRQCRKRDAHLVPVAEDDLEISTKPDGGRHHFEIGIDLCGLEQALSVDRVDRTRRPRALSEPQGMEIDSVVTTAKNDTTVDNLDFEDPFTQKHVIIIGVTGSAVQPLDRQSAILSRHGHLVSSALSRASSMRPLVRTVDRLQRLATFEAAARLGSFSAAGRELGLAQPAVTRQIQSLERSLDVSLFERYSNRSTLTDAGHVLADSLDTSFTALEHALGEISRIDQTFVLAMPPGFAQQLVVPRLEELQRALGDRDLRLWLYDREAELATSSFDAAVRVGTGAWPGFDCQLLLPEVVMPVATPAVAERWQLDARSSAEDVLAAPLLHMDADDRPWLSWSDWLAAFDLELTSGQRRVVFNNYPTVLQQVLSGKGVALAWSGLTDQMIADELLTIVGPAVTSERAYQVTWKTGRRTAALDSVSTWLTSTVTQP